MKILFFGSEKGFKRFEYENVHIAGFEFKLCTRFEQCRGTNFTGYIIHYTASKDLRREVANNYDLLKHLIRRQVD